MSLQPLPAQIVSRLRSGLNITSLSDALRELVYNAMDAGATQIDCWADPELWQIRVSDNGGGIARMDLDKVGSRYGAMFRFRLQRGVS